MTVSAAWFVWNVFSTSVQKRLDEDAGDENKGKGITRRILEEDGVA